MSSSLNRVFLLGNVNRAPEVRATREGRIIAQFNIVTHDSLKLPDGTLKLRAEWHNLIAYDTCAEYARHSVKAGAPVLVEGRLRTVSWPDKHGGDKRHKTEVVVLRFHGLTALSQLQPLAEEEPLEISA